MHCAILYFYACFLFLLGSVDASLEYLGLIESHWLRWGKNLLRYSTASRDMDIFIIQDTLFSLEFLCLHWLTANSVTHRCHYDVDKSFHMCEELWFLCTAVCVSAVLWYIVTTLNQALVPQKFVQVLPWTSRGNWITGIQSVILSTNISYKTV